MAKPVLTMAAAWASFDARVLRKASAIQKQEMRRAFYAGAASFLNVLMEGLDPDEEPTDGDMSRIAALHAELDRFGQDLQGGRA